VRAIAVGPSRRRLGPALAVGLAVVVAGAALGVGLSVRGSGPPSFQDRVQRVAAGLRCPVCQNLSVADSPSQLAQQMRSEIAARLRAGQTPEQVRQFFVGRYGDWILLSPPSHGLGLVPWLAPAAALVLGAFLVAVVLARRRSSTERAGEPAATAEERERIRRELEGLEEPE